MIRCIDGQWTYGRMNISIKKDGYKYRWIDENMKDEQIDRQMANGHMEGWTDLYRRMDTSIDEFTGRTDEQMEKGQIVNR